MRVRGVIGSVLVAFLPLALLYFAIPLLLLTFPHLGQHVFFLNFVKLPFVNYNNVSACVGDDLRALNFYLNTSGTETTPPLTLGVYHVLPRSLSDKMTPLTVESAGALLRDSGRPIVVYLHGNAFDRTTKHRCELYKLLAGTLDMHVLAIDYRGYGDSTGAPTELGVVEDAKLIYEYARTAWSTRAPIYIWGHSMGTGVGTRTVAELSMARRAPAVLVLESPFDNLPSVISHHPFSLPFRFLPWFRATLIDPLVGTGLVMSTDLHITKITCPILILHAQDDHIIPVQLARNLVAAARVAKRDVTYVEFDAERGFLHKYIHKAPELPDTLTMFFSKSSKTRSAQ